MMKKCSSCGEVKEEVEFYKRGGGFRADCKVCNKQRVTNYRRSARGKAVKDLYLSSAKGKYSTYKGNIKASYNITPEFVQGLMDIQVGCCPICKKSLDWCNSGRSYDIDHNHSTGVVRALLCRTCNTGIGQLQENTETLRNAISYLEEHNG